MIEQTATGQTFAEWRAELTEDEILAKVAAMPWGPVSAEEFGALSKDEQDWKTWSAWMAEIA